MIDFEKLYNNIQQNMDNWYKGSKKCTDSFIEEWESNVGKEADRDENDSLHPLTENCTNY